MQKKLMMITILAITVLGLTSISWAHISNNSLSLTFSCTIPAEPGVNAPLEEKAQAAPPLQQAEAEETENQAIVNEQPLILQEETQLAQGQSIQTIYYR